MNPRIVHVICGGINTGKTTFARYLQVGKKRVRRICMQELAYSIGIKLDNDNFFYTMATMLLMDGDVIIDGQHNKAQKRTRTIRNIKRLGADCKFFAYVIKRPLEECYDEYHSDDDVIKSHDVQYPALKEGFDKIVSVTWEDSSAPMMYGEDALMIKPNINVIHAIPNNSPVVVKPKKGVVKRKLERGRQNLFRPKKDKQ